MTPIRKGTMTFHSSLFEKPEDERNAGEGRTGTGPEFFGDLNFDQIVVEITAGKGEYDLTPFLCTPLNSVTAITFRHEVMQDLENAILFDNISAFALNLRTVRAHVAELDKRSNKHQKERWFLDEDLYNRIFSVTPGHRA